jgi:hypothetical protein
MSEVSRDLKIDKRVAKLLSFSAIKKDPVRALVELITNSDDSYRVLESHGYLTAGTIIVEVVRKHKNSIFTVIDNAEGFDAKTMDERVGGFGTYTSGSANGLDVRGFFGRGLKEAMLGLGFGKVISVKDNYLYQCTLTEEAHYEREEPIVLDKKTRKDLIEKLGIRENGTAITITATRDGVNIPQIDTLIFQLERHFSLREINASEKRFVYLCEKDERGRSKKGPIKLDYKPPLGKEILNKKNITLEDFPPAVIDLQVFKANDPLSQEGFCREGGILAKGKIAIHDITLFGFEGNPYAEKIFGTVRCKHIDDLVKKEEPIISDRRDGLDWGHPFAKSLKRAVDKELKILIEEIKKEEEAQKKIIENEKTRQRFRSAIEKINKIVKTELGEDEKGRIIDKEGKPSTPPPNGFDFIPEYYHIIAGNRSTLTLKAVVPWVLTPGTIINVNSDNEDVTIENKTYTVSTEGLIDGVAIFNPRIYGKRVGSEAIITATAKEFRAEALVKVVAKIEKKDEHKKRKGKGEGGLFEGITYDPTLSPKVRHYFDKQTRIIKISSKHPSVEIYLGPNGEGQNELHCQVLTAEIVTDAVCRELAGRKAQAGKLSILGEYMDAVYREHNRLINEYAHIIHQAYVEQAARRGKNL